MIELRLVSKLVEGPSLLWQVQLPDGTALISWCRLTTAYGYLRRAVEHGERYWVRENLR